MKKILLAFSLAAVALVSSYSANAQARLVIVHNSPDPATAQVDVWVQVPGLGYSSKAIDNFPFRNYFIFDVPVIAAGQATNVIIAPSNSTAVTDGFYTKSFPTGVPAGNFIVEAAGLQNAALKSVNPNDSFQLAVFPATLSAATGKIQASVFHGVPDAAPVTVQSFVTTIQLAKRDSLTTGLGFAAGSPYTEINAAGKRLHLYAGGASPAIQTNGDFLKSLGGAGLHIFASGFADTAGTGGGATLGLYYVSTTATTLASSGIGAALSEIPKEKVAGVVQVYHNSPDTTLGVIDLFVNGDGVTLNAIPGKAISFRGGFASAGFIQDFDYNIDIVDDGTTTPILSDVLRLNSDSVVAYVGGVGAGYAANPNSVSTAYTLFKDTTATLTTVAGKVGLNVFHGSPDAAAIDVFSFNENVNIVNNIKYGEFQKAAGGVPVDAKKYIIDVRGAGNTNSVKSYIADLSGFGGKSIQVFASGFLNPLSNKGGANFQLFAAIYSTPFPQVVALVDTVLANSINDPSVSDMNMRLFPNPATTSIQMVFDADNANDVAIEVVNVNGQVVKAVNDFAGTNGKQFAEVDIRDLNSGIYIVRVRNANKVSNYRFNIAR